MTAKELSKYLRLSESTIYKLASCNELPGFKIGDSWRFDMDEVNELIKKRKRVNEIRKRDSGVLSWYERGSVEKLRT